MTNPCNSSYTMSLSYPFLHLSGKKKYLIHPIVLCTILDSFCRRKENQNRIIGTLLGEINQGQVVIKDCFPVPYSDDKDRVEVDIDFHQNMYELQQQVNPNDVIVGWYFIFFYLIFRFATGKENWSDDSVIHDFYSKNIVKSPVFLLVGTEVVSEGFQVKAFINKKLIIGDQHTNVGNYFQRVPLQYKTFESEKVALNVIIKSRENNSTSILNEKQLLEETMKKLLFMLNQIGAFVKKVLGGELKADEQLLKFLEDAFTDLQTNSPQLFQKVLQENIQDLNMVVYLNNTLQNQLSLSEKLQNSM